MTAPERIWAAPPTDDPEWESGSGEWDVSENWAASCITEYIRADLAAVPAQVKVLAMRDDGYDTPTDPRDEVIARLVELAQELIDMQDWTGAGSSESGDQEKSAYQQKLVALAAAKAVQP